MQKQSWSVIVLCYNEESSIKEVVNNAITKFRELSNNNFEIIIVNDGSTDNSAKQIEQLKSDNPNLVNVISHPTNMGIGYGLRSGYFSAQKENVIFIPGDAQYDLNELDSYASFPDKEIICFYRVENTQYSIMRNGLSLINKLLNRFFLGIKLRDVNWVKAYKTKYLKDLDLQLTSSLIESEICAKLILYGIKPIEVRSKYLVRKGGKSKGANLKIVLKALFDVINLIFIVNKFKKSNNNLLKIR
ncbi:MAG: glycosyltransferase family 2 protein [Bacteroidetes bacterium]|nr:glycosyltransferase family 2 protein [Bacteroidota bacterium]